FLDHFFRKAVSQHVASQRGVDAAALQIEKLVLIELSDRRSMCALDVIRKDFKLRLGIDARFRRKQEILVGLLRVGLLRAMSHENLAVENRSRFAVENALVKLMTGAPRLAMIDDRVRVRVLIAVDHIKSI